MQLIPAGVHDCVNSKDFNPNNYSNDCPIGCLLEVDLYNSDNLHDA